MLIFIFHLYLTAHTFLCESKFKNSLFIYLFQLAMRHCPKMRK